MLELNKVLLAVPTKGLIDSNTVTRLQAIRDASPTLPPIQYVASKLSISDVRNAIVRTFLEHPAKYDYLILIDEEVVPHKNLLNILNHNEPIVGAPYFISRPEINLPFPGIFTFEKERKVYIPFEKPFEYYGNPALVVCDAVATGCIAIQRTVLEHPDMKAPFNVTYNAWGCQVMSDDVAFCSRAQKAGFDIYCDFGIPADHMIQGISMNMLHSQYARAYNMIKKAEEDKSRIIIP